MKVHFKSAILIGLVTVFLSACSSKGEETKPVDLSAVKVEIQGMEDAFAAGEKAKDVNAVAAYYSQDAVSHNRNAEPSVGMDAIKEKIAKSIAADSVGNSNVYKVADLFAEGNSAVEIGSWTTLNPAGEKVDSGYYMSYFEKKDGKYKCVRDMSVTSSAAKPPM